MVGRVDTGAKRKGGNIVGQTAKVSAGEARRRDEIAAAQELYAVVSRPLDGREVAEENDEAEAVLLDEMAAKLRRMGCGAKEAPMYVAAVVAVLREKDKAVAREVLGGAVEGCSLDMDTFKLRLGQTALRIVDAPVSRFSAGCLALAMGQTAQGMRSARQWGEAMGFSHEHANNGVEGWQDFLGLPRTSGQKSPASRATYRDTNGATAKGEVITS